MRLNLRTLLGLSLALLLSTSAPALADSFQGVTWQALGADQHPSVVFILTDTGLSTVTDATQGPYDGVEDSYIGVINNLSKVVTTLALTGSSGIFGFDGDWIDTFGGGLPVPGGTNPNASDNSGYGKSQGFFTGVTANGTVASGTVNFVGGLAAGGSTWFSLEGSPNALSLTPGAVREFPSLLLAGMAILGRAAGSRLLNLIYSRHSEP
jgi:hypothetical protein